MSRSMFFLSLIVVVSIATSLRGQTFTKEMKDTVNIADKHFKKKEYNKALPLYLSALVQDSLSIDFNHKIGVCKINSKKNRKGCAKYLLKAAELGDLESILYLGKAYHYEMKFDEAIEAYIEYLNIPAISTNNLKDFSNTEVERLIAQSEYAIKLVGNPLNATINNLDWANSIYSDYAPVISANEDVLIFTSRRPGSTGELTDSEGRFFEDIYITHNTNGVWGSPQNMGPKINTMYHDAGIGLAPDGQMLFVYRSNVLGGGDIYYSKLDGLEWGRPEFFENDINTYGNESSASLAAQNDIIYFSSDRDGGMGGKDIYMVRKLPNGKWGLAVNLGSDINTPLDEDGPFIHPNGKTLYFSSESHDNMGGFDIFSSEIINDTTWTKPENLQYPINTVDDDMYFVLSTDGKRAYYSTQREDGMGETDLFMINMPGNSFNLVLLQGDIKGDQEEVLYDATITVINANTEEIEYHFLVNDKTGKYLGILDPQKDYYIKVEAANHYMYREELKLGNNMEYQEITRNIKLKPIESGD